LEKNILKGGNSDGKSHFNPHSFTFLLILIYIIYLLLEEGGREKGGGGRSEKRS
jgi:hypothetical protein